MASLDIPLSSLASIVWAINDFSTCVILGLYALADFDAFILRFSFALVVGIGSAPIACEFDELHPLRWSTVDLIHKSGPRPTLRCAVRLRVPEETSCSIVNNTLRCCNIYCSVEINSEMLEVSVVDAAEGNHPIGCLVSLVMWSEAKVPGAKASNSLPHNGNPESQRSSLESRRMDSNVPTGHVQQSL